MWLAKEHGKSVRCEYMPGGWKVRWIAASKGWFNISPHTGTPFKYVPQKIDHESKWSVLK